MEKTKKRIGRITTFDLLRGYFLVAIVIDHINFFPNGLDWWSARGGLYVTTAEGFFLISGIVLGIVRGAKLVDKPMKKVTELLLKRSLQLYLTLVVLVFAFTFVGWTFFMNDPGLKGGILPPSTNIFDLLYQTLTLQYFYGWADYLRLYALFLLASPLVFWLLRKGWWYVVLALSLLVWSLFPNDPNYWWEFQEKMQPVSWQLIFFIGTIIGFHWADITDRWQKLSKNVRRGLTTTVVSLATITIFINVLIMLSTQGNDFSAIGITATTQHDLYVNFFDKERMPLTRIGLFLLWFGAFFWAFKRFEKPITKWLGWLLLPFGTNSLYVYTMHAIILLFLHVYFEVGSLLYNFVVTLGVILFIRLLIHYKVLMKIIPR